MKNEEYVLELNGITKIFPGVKALEDISFGVKKGEVHALVGENGAGKSTLINIISGVFPPTEGRMAFEGKEVRFHTPQDAFMHGIGVVHQERNLMDTFNIMENISFNYITKSMGGIAHKKEMQRIASEALARVKLELPLNGSLDNLSSGQKQMLEIARALTQQSKVLLLDEPTASISLGEVEILLQTVERLRDEGVSIIYISHKLEEVFRIADNITIIRDGKKIGETVPKDSITKEDLIEKMVGRKTEEITLGCRDFIQSPVVLEARQVRSKLDPKKKGFVLRKGEILGWYGLVGAGRTEFARQLIGIDPITEGEIWVDGAPADIKNYIQAIRQHHIYYISENRKEEGLFLSHTISTNIGISSLDQISNRAGMLSYPQKDKLAEEYMEKLRIKATGIYDLVMNLSGGNQQKVCIAKGLATQPGIIIIDEPTVGIDVNTKSEIHRLIHQLSEEGMSVIVISSDLTEVLNISDRLLVFKEGEITGELVNSKDYDGMSKEVMSCILM
ncbi:sugar ABC transporter ATP-binding protein [Christensenella timonensis]|uniref:sugar ABC transporter ATP-binding protein n=1 Tax=Christensenella timonensis TaxID=1816678 RepID=UPI00082B3919|nr:sugar ABC transporter ATP-binding protein [Christensenella timonensis]